MEILKARPDITNLVKSVAQEQGIENCDIVDVKTNEKGEGYLGQIFMCTVKDAGSEKRLDVVIKAAFVEEKIRNSVPIEKCFLNEIYFYKDVYPYFKKIGEYCGISDGIYLIPKCYGVFVKCPKEMLCLENLKTLGFEMYDKKLTLDHDHVSLIFKTYGRFHAYSFALRDQKPDEYSRLVSRFHNVYREILNNPNSRFQEHLKGLVKLVEKYLVPGEDDEVTRKLAKYKDGIVSSFSEAITENCNYSAILHGDCWSNNMMFKYKVSEIGKQLSDIRLLDMQIVKVGSPVCDLSYCLYSGASKQIFDKLNEYLKIYHESFSTFLRQLGSNPDDLFPFDALKDEWKKYAKFGMIMSFTILKMKATNKEDVVDFSDKFDEIRDKVANVKFNEEEYKKRIKELLYHLSKLDVL